LVTNGIIRDIWRYSQRFECVQTDDLCELIFHLHDVRIVSDSLGYETLVRQCFNYYKQVNGREEAYVFINKFKFYREKYKKSVKQEYLTR
jgi:hypothetical protein